MQGLVSFHAMVDVKLDYLSELLYATYQNQAKSDEGFHDVESSKPCSVDGMR